MKRVALKRVVGILAIITGGAAAGEAIREFSTGLYLALSPERPGAPHPDTGLFATMSFVEPMTIVRIIVVAVVSVVFFRLGLRILDLRLNHLRSAQAASLCLLAISGAAFVEVMIRVWFAVFVFPATQSQQIAFEKTLHLNPPIQFGFPAEVTQLLVIWTIVTLASLTLGLVMFSRTPDSPPTPADRARTLPRNA
jgi:hypothetical protein